MNFDDRLCRARHAALKAFKPLKAPYPACCLFFSVGDPSRRAVVVHAVGDDFASAWVSGVEQVARAVRARQVRVEWLRIDWVCDVQELSAAQFNARLRGTKRNYFRQGIALDVSLRTALTEQELNANAILYLGPSVPHAAFNDRNFAAYARSRFAGQPARDPAAPVHVFTTEGVFVEPDGTCHALGGSGLHAGRRRMEPLSADDVLGMVACASDHLARQVDEAGRFVYGYFPCFDRRIDAYNMLRHASSTYAMVEAWEETRCPQLKAAIDRALSYIVTQVKYWPGEAGTPMAMLVDTGDEIKLGGNAVLILALTKYCTVTGTSNYLPLAQALARGIGRMQDPATGRFVHVLHAADLSVKAENRIIYYEGEAAFSLMRLYEATGDATWLDMVERAFRHFIAAEHWRAHDHWLAYCVDALTRHRPMQAYYRFGIRNIAGYLDFVADRITTFPTLLELMMAAHAMLQRMSADATLAPLLHEVDIARFQQALERRAHRLLDGYFWPEFAMYMRNPARIVGAFFIRHHAFRVRIDDVEHYLSGYVAYLRYVRAGRPALAVGTATGSGSPAAASVLWDADSVRAATGGEWVVPPAPGWHASGVCLWRPTMQPGNLVLVRTADAPTGVPPRFIAALAPSAVITQHADWRPTNDVPVLRVGSLDEAVFGLGRHARQRLSAPVLAVTGSAGKTTTVAMLASTLRAFGKVAETRHNANLPRGIAWNLASFAPDTGYVVLELAIGRMRANAELARPDVAIFTNIAPAHLSYHGTLAEVANRKSAIFEGMEPGANAILNRDMAEFDRVADAARARGLRITTYGQAADADVRLVDYRAAGNRVAADLFGRRVMYELRASGRHMAMNSLAVLCAVHMLGLPLAEALSAMSGFAPLAGRGEPFSLQIDGRRVLVVDDAYNANPESMAAALEAAGAHPAARKMLVLGDMLELGDDEVRFHRGLAGAVRATRASRIVLCGTLMKALADVLRDESVTWCKDVDEVLPALSEHLAEMDYVLIKGSGAMRLSEVVADLRASLC